MFSWRKHTAQEEEPLVPHGLIWQATEEPMPPRAEDNHPSASRDTDKLASPPQALPAAKMPMGRVESPAPPPVSIGNLAPKLDDIPQPLPWASLNAKDSLKKQPVLDDASFWRTATRPGNVSGPSSRPTQSALPDTEDQKAVLIEIAQAQPRKQVHARFTEDCRREVSRAWSEASHAVSELCANAKHSYTAWGIRNKVGQARQDAAARIGQLRIDISRQSKAAAARRGRTLSSAMTSSVAAAKGAASRVQNKLAFGLRASSQFAARLSTRQVNVRIPTGGQIASLSQRLRRAYADSRLVLQRNSRLATSMTMAGFSAVLTLGLILIVSRYQPSANAGTRAVTSTLPQRTLAVQPVSSSQTESLPSQKAEPTSAKPAVSAPVPAGQTSSPKPSAVVSTALRAPIPPQSKPVATRRPHRNADEDYVARDTYVYYGAKGKQSR